MSETGDTPCIPPSGNGPDADAPQQPSGDTKTFRAVLGRRLRNQRVARNLTRKAVSDQLGLAPEEVADHESGVDRINPAVLAGYSRFFGVPLSTFFAEPSEEELAELAARASRRGSDPEG